MPQWTFIFPFPFNWMLRDSFPLNTCARVVAVYKQWHCWCSYCFTFPSESALEALLTPSGHQRSSTTEMSVTVSRSFYSIWCLPTESVHTDFVVLNQWNAEMQHGQNSAFGLGNLEFRIYTGLHDLLIAWLLRHLFNSLNNLFPELYGKGGTLNSSGWLKGLHEIMCVSILIS